MDEFSVTCNACGSPAIIDVTPGGIDLVCTACPNYVSLAIPQDDGEPVDDIPAA